MLDAARGRRCALLEACFDGGEALFDLERIAEPRGLFEQGAGGADADRGRRVFVAASSPRT